MNKILVICLIVTILALISMFYSVYQPSFTELIPNTLHPCTVLFYEGLEIIEDLTKLQKTATAQNLIGEFNKDQYNLAMIQVAVYDDKLNALLEKIKLLNCHEIKNEWITDKLIEKIADSSLIDLLD